MGLPGLSDGGNTGYNVNRDDASTGLDVVHKATSGFVRCVHINVDGAAYNAGATLQIKNGATVLWELVIPALGADGQSIAQTVWFDAIFSTSIVTNLTAASGSATVIYA